MVNGPIPGPWGPRSDSPMDPRSFWSGCGCGAVLGATGGVLLVLLGMWLGGGHA